MKNDIKKYLTLGAALAGSAFMVSCDGDDGAPGATGPAGADGAAQYELFELAPAKELLPLGQFTLTVEDDTNTDFVTGDQLQFDVDTQRLYEYSLYEQDAGGGFTNSGNITSQLGSWDTQAIVEGDPTFTIIDIDLDNDPTTDDSTDNYNIDSLTFTPNKVSLGTQSGTFELVVSPENVNINVEPNGAHEATPTNSPEAGPVTLYRNITGNVIEITDATATTVTIDLPADFVVFATDTGTYIAHLAASVTDAPNVDLAGLTDAGQVFTTTALALAEGSYAKITIENPGTQNISGTYRFDLDGSIGTNQGNPSDPQR